MQVEQLWSDEDAARLASFRQAVSEERLATALLALEGADAPTTARCEASLDQWAELLSLRVQPDNATRCADGLRKLMVRQLSFRGDTKDYYNADNARLSRVIDRRKGMPILLSSVWIEVGRRAGIEMHGIGMPGHFIARVGGREGPLVDPFSGGCRLSIKQCAHIVGRLSDRALPWTEEYLRPVLCDKIVERVLRNLLHAHRRTGDVLSLFRVSRFHAELRNEDPEPQLLHACLAEEIGAYHLAEKLYLDVVVAHPDTKEARVAKRRYEKVCRHCVAVH
mgnify:CR=1 FL=1|jgi:regulator of sirC expression with transglutaminase-like and TPR domain